MADRSPLEGRRPLSDLPVGRESVGLYRWNLPQCLSGQRMAVVHVNLATTSKANDIRRIVRPLAGSRGNHSRYPSSALMEDRRASTAAFPSICPGPECRHGPKPLLSRNTLPLTNWNGSQDFHPRAHRRRAHQSRVAPWDCPAEPLHIQWVTCCFIPMLPTIEKPIPPLWPRFRQSKRKKSQSSLQYRECLDFPYPWRPA